MYLLPETLVHSVVDHEQQDSGYGFIHAALGQLL